MSEQEEKEIIYEKHKMRLIEYLSLNNITLEEKDTDLVISKLMEGEIHDSGGLTAIRGFVYQYYVTILYILRMCHPKSDVWWDKVVFEYFDDIALLSDERIRIIQVKTKKEHTGQNIQVAKMIERPKKTSAELEDRDHFNSWIDKLFLTYDRFLESNLDFLSNLDKDCFKNPQFELVTNSTPNALTDIEKYTTNSSFDMTNVISTQDDKIKSAITASKKINNVDVDPQDVYKKPLDFYLTRLYVNKLGPFIALKEEIEDLLKEIVDLKQHDIQHTFVAGIFKRLLSQLISRTYRDDGKFDKRNLVFHKTDILSDIRTWKAEIADSVASFSDNHSLLDMVNKSVEKLRLEFEDFKKESLRNELIDTLDWFKNQFNEQFKKDSSYTLIFLNKLFNLSTTIKHNIENDDEHKKYIRNSISYIILCLVVYPERRVDIGSAQLLFHTGMSSDDKLLFTIHNAREEQDEVYAKNKVLTAIKECEFSTNIREEYFCLIVDEKLKTKDNSGFDFAATFRINRVKEETPKIGDKPENLIFITKEHIVSFYESLRDDENLSLNTFLDEELNQNWKKHVLIGEAVVE
jgi:hypothetical protein